MCTNVLYVDSIVNVWYVLRMTILITRDLHDSIARDTSPEAREGEIALNIVDSLIDLLGSGNHQVAEIVTSEMLKDPVLSNRVIAMAIGVLTQCERKLIDSAQSLRTMAPNVRAALVAELANERDLSPEKASEMVDEYLKTI